MFMNNFWSSRKFIRNLIFVLKMQGGDKKLGGKSAGDKTVAALEQIFADYSRHNCFWSFFRNGFLDHLAHKYSKITYLKDIQTLFIIVYGVHNRSIFAHKVSKDVLGMGLWYFWGVLFLNYWVLGTVKNYITSVLWSTLDSSCYWRDL